MTLKFRHIVRLLFFQAAFLCAVYGINLLLSGYFFSFGLVPRSLNSLGAILSATFIHRDLSHLLSNLFALTMLGGFCLLYSQRFYLRASVFIILCSGALVWCFARDGIHVGASGWIFGLWSLLLYKAWSERKPMPILIGLIVIFLYGGMIFGLIPTSRAVSYEYHFFGALSGIIYGFLTQPPHQKSK